MKLTTILTTAGIVSISTLVVINHSIDSSACNHPPQTSPMYPVKVCK